ncbi:hypothetical protein COV19_04775 [Candidatus Woesearchaeota archaeon CG10_big_fil_rev_8_21_14_0_10_44_13]|nr:MAG: hypothetical protein COV19_04775 [Candidatus Woesearchaeota archaeon CG10_big_fil_rev_8_21_14_0_10_44_13]
MPDLRNNLLKRGWAKEEVDRAMNIMNSEEKRLKHIRYNVGTNFVVYWAVLLVLTIANFLVSIMLIPFLLVMKPFLVEIIVGVMGLVFGLLFNLVIRDIEHIETKHHLAAAVFIPAIAIINIFVVVNVANAITARIKIPLAQNPIFVSLIYVVMFLLPYGLNMLREFLSRNNNVLQSKSP